MISIKYRAEIETKTLEYEYTETVEDNDAEGQKEEVGKYPFIYINGVQIENQSIKELKLFNNTMFPTLEMTFSDPTSVLLMNEFPVDDTILSLYKRSTSDGLMDIKMDFKITNFTTINGVSGDQVSFKLKAILNVDDLYLFNYESYEDTTYNILDELSKDMKLGFASNISNTNDKMKWINPGDYRQNFIADIIKNSYIDDTTYLFGYIDFYYNFNYIDINKQLNEDISQQMAINSNERMNGTENEYPNEPLPLILTNNKDAISTTMYISKYTINQDSTEINIDTGYRYRYSAYNKTDDQYRRYMLDSISDSGKGIVLKGNPFTTDGILYEESIGDEWMGKLDTYNVHENYLHSELQNKNNLKFLQKLKMTVKMGKPNYSLYRFQKLLVELYNFGKLEDSDEPHPELTPGSQDENKTKIINYLSGEWIITAINYTFTSKDSTIQELTLVKRELTEVYDFPRREDKK